MKAPGLFVNALNELQSWIEELQNREGFNAAEIAFILSQMAWTYHGQFDQAATKYHEDQTGRSN